MKDMCFETLWNEMANLAEVEAIVLAGSRASERYDEKSDYDLYIYCQTIPSKAVRKDILEKTCGYIELGNAFWELEDDCTLKSGIDIDILYRQIDKFEQKIAEVVESFVPSNGYTTCVWHNILNSIILYDQNNRFKMMQKRFDVSYPEKLKENIIQQNRTLLSGFLPSYDLQLKKAIERNDLPSVNHRLSAFIESYFDIIFALNEMTHPGEKRMLAIAKEKASTLPRNFEMHLTELFRNAFVNQEETKKILGLIIEELDVLLGKKMQKIH